jgi:hypothetical protein
MFAIDASNSRYLKIRADGRLSPRDYDSLEPEVETALRQAQGQQIALLLDLRRWSGWTPGGFVRDLCFDLKHRNSFSRIAVVGEKRWHRLLTLAAKPLFSGPMRYFDQARQAEAADWAGAKVH